MSGTKLNKTVILFGFNLRLGERYMPKFLDAPSWYNSDGYLVRDEGYTYYHHIRIRFTPLGGLQVYRYSNSAWSQTTIQEDYVTVYLMIPGPVNQEVADFNTLFHTLGNNQSETVVGIQGSSIGYGAGYIYPQNSSNSIILCGLCSNYSSLQITIWSGGTAIQSGSAYNLSISDSISSLANIISS